MIREQTAKYNVFEQNQNKNTNISKTKQNKTNTTPTNKNGAITKPQTKTTRRKLTPYPRGVGCHPPPRDFPYLNFPYNVQIRLHIISHVWTALHIHLTKKGKALAATGQGLTRKGCCMLLAIPISNQENWKFQAPLEFGKKQACPRPGG